MQLEVFYAKNRDIMVKYLTKFSGDRESAADAVSEAFCKALSQRSMLNQMPEPALKAWLYAAARNSLIDAKRKNARLSSYDPSADDRGAWDPDPADRLAVQKLVNALPEKLRKPVALRYFAGLNATEIGIIMDLPPATVRTRLRQAMTMMKKEYGGKL